MKHLKLVPVLLLLLTVVVICFSSCGDEGSSPSDTIESAYDLMKAEKYEKVTALYVTRDGEKFTDEEAKKMEGLLGMAAKEQFGEKGGLKNVVIDKETIDDDGNGAKVVYTVNFKNGDSEIEDVSMIKINGKWFIKM